jgi:hypothetical protein
MVCAVLRPKLLWISAILWRWMHEEIDMEGDMRLWQHAALCGREFGVFDANPFLGHLKFQNVAVQRHGVVNGLPLAG